MPYDLGLAERLDEVTVDISNMGPIKMFGGIGHMLNGNMCVGIYKDFLVLRLGPDRVDAILAMPHTKPMDLTGKVMKGWVMMAPDGYEDQTDLEHFVGEAVAFVKTLPPK